MLELLRNCENCYGGLPPEQRSTNATPEGAPPRA